MRRSNYVSLLLVAVGFISIVLGCQESSFNERAQNSSSPPSSTASSSNIRQTWAYGEDQEKMGRGVIRWASIESTNTVSFSFPYQGEQHATLALVNHPVQGKEVILRIERGQFQTGIDGARVVVRFDDK